MTNFNYQVGIYGTSSDSESFIRYLTMNCLSLSIYSKNKNNLSNEGFTIFDNLNEMINNLSKTKIIFVLSDKDNEYNNNSIIFDLLQKLPEKSWIIDLGEKPYNISELNYKKSIEKNIYYFDARFVCSSEKLYLEPKLIISGNKYKYDEFYETFKNIFKENIKYVGNAGKASFLKHLVNISNYSICSIYSEIFNIYKANYQELDSINEIKEILFENNLNQLLNQEYEVNSINYKDFKEFKDIKHFIKNQNNYLSKMPLNTNATLFENTTKDRMISHVYKSINKKAQYEFLNHKKNKD